MGKNYEDIMAGAMVFSNTAILLGAMGKAGLDSENKGKEMTILSQTMIPAIALKGFSCELALKALIARCGGTVDRTHELDVLYGRIGDEDKSAISKKVIEKIKLHDASYDEEKFMIDLKEAANTFVKWRYFYEKSVSANLNFIEIFFGELMEHARK